MPRVFIPTYDAIETEVTFLLGGVYMSNRMFYWYPESLWGPFVELDFASALGDWVINRYLAVIASDVLFIHARARKANSSSAPWYTIPYTGYFGAWPDVAMSANVTCRLTMARKIRAHDRIGSVRVVGVPRSAVVENTFTDEYRSAVREAFIWAQEFPTLIGAEWSWVSYQANGVRRSEGLVKYAGITSVEKDVRPQRKRLKNSSLYP